jgi:hypothetical protein
MMHMVKNTEAQKVAQEMTIQKADLTERKRGIGGTMVRLAVPHPTWGDTVVVKDLMQRKGCSPTRIGVGPTDRGIAFGVELVAIAEVL